MLIFKGLALILFLFLTSAAFAQTLPPSIITADISTAKLVWEHSQLKNVDTFTVICESLKHSVDAPAMEAPLADFITTSGPYTCSVTATNRFGTSLPSNSLTFEAGDKPVAPMNAAIVIQ